MCTHLHVDHVGWNTRLENGRWVPTFPNARYVFAKTEFDYWTEQNAKSAGAAVRRQRAADRRSQQAEIVRDDFAIGDHARILPTPGHTPGHVAFTFGRGKDDAVFSGDLMHSPLQTRYPELSVKFDVDQAQAASDAPQFPGALLRHRHAVLHGAFPLAVGREDPAAGQWIYLRGGVAAILPRPACGGRPDLRTQNRVRGSLRKLAATWIRGATPHPTPLRKSGVREKRLNQTGSACGSPPRLRSPAS